MPNRTRLSWHEIPRGVVLEGPHWELEYDLLLGLFNLRAPDYPTFHMRWGRARAHYDRGGRAWTASTDDGRAHTWQASPVEDDQGVGLRLTVQSGNRRRPALEFAATLYQDSPLLVLELSLHNTLSQPIAVEALQPLDIDPEWGGRLSLGSPIAGLYSTGWQSWSPAGWKPAQARDLRTRLSLLAGPMHDAPLIRPLRPGRFRADMVGVLTPTGEGPRLLVGLLSTADQLGALQARLDKARPALTFTCATDGIPLAPEERLSSERVALLLAPPGGSPLEQYGEALGREMGTEAQESAPRGWCSWTAFYLRMAEEDVLRQLAWLAEHRDTLPVEVVQVDDGWEQIVGDWEPNERFPHGMAWLAEEIRRAGFVPGLWLAPLIVHPDSRLAQNHPDWILRDGRGRPVNAGYGWGHLFNGLDVTLPEVQDWLRQLISTAVQDWGYTYLKLDFLYAVALPGQRHRPTLTRAQALHRALQIIRQAAGPQTFLLGCGCPLGPAIGLVEAMRIGTDVAPNWWGRHGPLTPLLRYDPSFPATATCLRNAVTQAWMHRRLWLNDPDALIQRQAGNRMKEAEVRTLTTVVALSGGSWMLGDDLPALEQDRRALAAVGLPLHHGRPFSPDLLSQEWPKQLVLEQECPWGQGWVVGLFNWGERPADLALDLTTLGLPADTACHLHEFWSGEYRRVQDAVRFEGVESHGCRTFLLRPVEEGPQWAGSTLHLIQGQEVQSWEHGVESVTLTIDAGRALEGSVLLWLPQGPPGQVEAHGGTACLRPIADSLWRLHLETDTPDPLRVAVPLPRH